MIAGPIAGDDIPLLCARLHRIVIRSGAPVVVCDVRTLPASAVAVDALARLQLTARRLGSRIRLQHVSRELDELLAFAGLAGALARGPAPPCGGLRVEPGGQPEVREEPVGVEEAVDRDDAVT